MIKTTRQTVIGALALASAGASAQTQTTPPAPAPAPPAQQPNSTIGNPQLKNFELPGTRTVPAPPVQEPAAPPPQAQTPRTEPAAPARTETRPQPQPRAEQRAPVRAEPTPRSEAPPPPAAEQAPPAAEPPMLVPEPLNIPPPVTQALPQAQPVVPTPAAQPETSFPWLYLALGGLLVLLAFFAFGKFRRQPRYAHARAAAPAMPAPAPAPPIPAPAPAPAPVAAPAPSGGIVGIQVRPWIELEFRPDRAAATMTDASVQYELIVRNKGNAPAHNIRIEARMFNASSNQEQEIGAFYAEPVRERTPPSIATIPARGEIQLRSAVSMPKEEVREITVQGRRLFIPMVAFNVIYDWGNGRSGQTSTSYLVGREPEKASDKMGAFRLDLGPRLYRSVGQRQTTMARIV